MPYPTDGAPVESADLSGYPKDGGPVDKLPGVREPNTALDALTSGAEHLLVPRNELEAWLTIGTSAIPGLEAGLGKLSEMAADKAPTIARLLGYMGKRGVGPGLARTGLSTAIGAGSAAASGQPISEGAERGAEAGVGGEVIGALGRRITGANAADAAAREVVSGEQADRMLQQQAGLTRGQAGTLAQPSGLPMARERGETVRAINEARRGVTKQAGELFEPIYEPLNQREVPVETLGGIAKGAKAARESLEAQGYVGPKGVNTATKSLLNEAETLAPTDRRPSHIAPNVWAAMSPDQRAQGLEDLGMSEDGPMQVQKLRGLLGRMMEQGASTASPIDRRAMFEASKPITEYLDNIVPPEQRDLLRSIKDHYAQTMSAIDPKLPSQLRKATTLPDVGEVLMKTNPVGAQRIVATMSPEQLQLAQRAVGAHLLQSNSTPEKLAETISGNALYRQIFNGTPLADTAQVVRDAAYAKRFVDLGKKLSPQQAQDFAQGVQRGMNNLSPEAAQAATEALQDHTKMGRTASRLAGYATTWGPIGAIGGWGAFHHEPLLAVPAAVYFARRFGWMAMMQNPAMANGYRSFIMNGWTRAGGEAFGRMMATTATDVLNDYAKGGESVVNPPASSAVAVPGTP